jgi:hypothetical protein
LSRCCLLSLCDLAQQINQGQVRLSSFLAKARDDIAKVGANELGSFVDLAGEEALAQRAKGNKSDPEFFEGRQQFLFRASPLE